MFSSLIKEVYNPKTFFPHAALLHQAFAHCAISPTAASRRSLGRVSVPMWPFNLSVRLPIVDLVGRYPTNYLIGREPIFQRIAPLIICGCPLMMLCGISSRFQLLSPSERQVTHALLTRPPLSSLVFPPKSSVKLAPFDLHVLGTPPAFVLSQDQTLCYLYHHSFRCNNLNSSFSSFKHLRVSLYLSRYYRFFRLFLNLYFRVSFFALFNFQGSCRSVFRALDYNTKLPLLCQVFFSTFFKKI